MQPPKASPEEISVLESEIDTLKKLLDKSIREDEILEKTKAIFHDLKSLVDKLADLKKNSLHKAEG